VAAATWLLAQGADQRVVMEILGYSRFGMTNRYARMLPKVMAEGPGVAARPLEVRCAHNCNPGGPDWRNEAKKRQVRGGAPPGTRTPNPRIKSLSAAGSPGLTGVRTAAQTPRAYLGELGRTAVTCNPDCNPWADSAGSLVGV